MCDGTGKRLTGDPATTVLTVSVAKVIKVCEESPKCLNVSCPLYFCAWLQYGRERGGKQTDTIYGVRIP
jgi:hypothetical protein